jgi:hypothetical protein
LFGKPGAGFVKPLDGGFQLGGLFLVRQKLDLQGQFHGGALYIQISSIPSNLRNSSPSKSLRKAYAIVDGESLRGEVEGRIGGCCIGGRIGGCCIGGRIGGCIGCCIGGRVGGCI